MRWACCDMALYKALRLVSGLAATLMCRNGLHVRSFTLRQCSC